MAGAAGLLALLDAAILSASPDLTRMELALAVTVVVGVAIAAIWRTNSRLERASAERGSGAPRPGTGS